MSSFAYFWVFAILTSSVSAQKLHVTLYKHFCTLLTVLWIAEWEEGDSVVWIMLDSYLRALQKKDLEGLKVQSLCENVWPFCNDTMCLPVKASSEQNVPVPNCSRDRLKRHSGKRSFCQSVPWFNNLATFCLVQHRWWYTWYCILVLWKYNKCIYVTYCTMSAISRHLQRTDQLHIVDTHFA